MKLPTSTGPSLKLHFSLKHYFERVCATTVHSAMADGEYMMYHVF